MSNEIKRITYIAFGIYLILLFWLVVFHLSTDLFSIEHYRNINFLPYAQSALLNGGLDMSEIVYNILVFLPIGYYLMVLGHQNHPVWNIYIGFFLSLLFEIIQYIFALGASDITDVINNTIGVIVGVLIYILIGKYFNTNRENLINSIVLPGSILLVIAYLLLVMMN